MRTKIVLVAGLARRPGRRLQIFCILAAGLFQFASTWAIAGETCPYGQGQNVTVVGSVWDHPLKRSDGYVAVAVKTVECPDDLFNLFINPQIIQTDACAKGSMVSAAGQIYSIASIFPGRIFNITASSTTCTASQHDARDNCLTGTSLRADNDCIEAARLYPDDADVQFNLGKYHKDQKDPAAALLAYKLAIALNPKKQPYYTLGCQAAAEIKDWSTVEALCTKSLDFVREADPASKISQIVVLESRASAYMAREMYDKAIADYTRAGELEVPLTVDFVPGIYQVRRGIAYRAKGDFANAMIDFRAAAQLAPKSASVPHWQGWTLYDATDAEGAVAAFAHELKLAKTVDPYTVIMIYFARLRLGDTSAAQKLTKGASRVTDKAAWPWPVIEVLEGKRAAAEVLATAKAASADQECAASFYLGEWYAVSKDKDQAEPLLRKAVADCPHDFVERQSANFALPRLLGGAY